MTSHADIYLPHRAKIMERQQESDNIISLALRFIDEAAHQAYTFAPGQFNMLYLFGVGEVAISIVSDPEDKQRYYHTIRRVGRVTKALFTLREHDVIGIRGPFGRGWPLEQAQGQDVLVITGGLGCAPSVSVINYIAKRRNQFGRLFILQGVKHSTDFIFKSQYEQWKKLPDTQVLLSASESAKNWPWFTGYVTDLLDHVELDPNKTICMMCGPELMMMAAIKKLKQRNMPEEMIYLSMERNMRCAVGHCGHCQFGGSFVCKDGPVFCYPEIKQLFGKKGF